MTARLEPPASDEAAPFWDATREQRFVLPWCTECERAIWYPRTVCPRCLGTRSSGATTSATAPSTRRASTRSRAPGRDDDDGPYVVVLVDLDAGVRMMTNVVGCPPDDVAVGMRAGAGVGTAVRRPAPAGVPRAGLSRCRSPTSRRPCPSSCGTPRPRFGDRTYLVADGERLTYRDVDTRSAALAKGLLAEGIGKGSRVGDPDPEQRRLRSSPPSASRASARCSCRSTRSPRRASWAGCCDTPTSRTSSRTRRFLNNDYLERLEAALPGLAGQRADQPLFLPDAPFLRAVHVWGRSDRSWSRGDEAAIVAAGARAGIDDEFLVRVEECVVPADPAVIVYSSGSTADPKGAIHSQGAVVRHSCNVLVGYPIERDDVMFSSMPFFWIGGLITALLPGAARGRDARHPELVRARRRPRPHRAGTRHHRHRLAPAGQDAAASTRRTRPSASRTVVRTSMADLVPPEHRPPEVNSTSLGMTEMCSVHISWDQYDPLPESRRGTFGKSLPGISHKVVDPDTLDEVPVGVDGELWARGYSLMQGLHRREREDVFEPDGWYRTGDAGHFDDDGWFYFTGRLGEMIKTPGGANVAPAEVEAALMAYPDVLEAYVTGIPADGDGELVVGAVVPRGDADLDADELRARLKGDLSAYKVPKQLWVCAKSELPFLQSGKIKKQDLADQLAARFGSG